MQAQRAKPSTATENRERSAPAGRQAKPLCKAASAALLYLLHLLHLLNTPCWAVGASAPFSKAWRAKPAMPLQAPGPDVRFTRTHGPPLRRLLCVLFGPLGLHGDSQNTLAVLRALARRPSLCLSVFSVVSVFFVICGSPHWQSFFVSLRVLCVLCDKLKTLHFCPAASSVARLPRAPNQLISQSANQQHKGRSSAPPPLLLY